VETERLDLQHYALREVVGNVVAPIESPRRVFDSCSGSGQWGFDLCAQYPNAVVVAVDRENRRPGGPDSYLFVRANVLDGLSFQSDQFDYVHQRLALAGIPLEAWTPLVAELVRVARPGGWVELAEPNFAINQPGQATSRLLDLMKEMAVGSGLDSTGIVYKLLDGYLEQAGLLDVERRLYTLPLGTWGGRVGSLLGTNFRSAWQRLAEAFEARLGFSRLESHELINTATQECEERRTTWSFAVAFGRKPG
jgi:SAM-dependent methyltransferase